MRALGGAGRGGPGGGGLDAEPLGFIDVTAAGARFEAVPAPARAARRTAPGLVAVAAAGAVAAAALGRGRRPRLRALPR